MLFFWTNKSKNNINVMVLCPQTKIKNNPVKKDFGLKLTLDTNSIIDGKFSSLNKAFKDGY